MLASCAGVPDLPPPTPWRIAALPPVWRLLRWLWAEGVTPFTLIRLLGPVARSAVRLVLVRRVSRVPETSSSRVVLEEPLKTAATEYMLQNMAAPASGDQAMTTLLHPGVHAVVPIGPRLASSPPRDTAAGATPIPVTFIYGGPSDWMDSVHAVPVVAAIKAAGGLATIEILPTSGHHVMLDDPVGFNAAVLKGAEKCTMLSLLAVASDDTTE